MRTWIGYGIMDYDKIEKKIETITVIISPEKLAARNADIRSMMNARGFWQREDSSRLSAEYADNAGRLNELESLRTRMADLKELAGIANNDDNAFIIDEYNHLLTNVDSILQHLVITSVDYHDRGALLTLKAGSGGTESENWCHMLMTMYMRWAESHDYNVSIDDVAYGDGGAGYQLLRSVTLRITRKNGVVYSERNANIYGLLSGEAGRHKLIRISPFDKNKRRQTSLVAVDVIPILDEHELDADSIVINPADIRVDVFNASGPGGQGVNTTYSAVRITHVPTGIVVSQQDERDQHLNKRKAMLTLRTRLLMLREQEKKESLRELSKDVSASRGGTIRNYVLYPYKLVKDARTAFSTDDVDGMLAGNVIMNPSNANNQATILDGFIGSELEWMVVSK